MTWSRATPTQILADINQMIESIAVASQMPRRCMVNDGFMRQLSGGKFRAFDGRIVRRRKFKKLTRKMP